VGLIAVGLIRKLCIAIAVILMWQSLAFADLSDPNGEIRIGAIASLAGPAAEQGRNWLDGALLAVEELKKQGVRVKLYTEDDATRPARVTLAFNKLVKIDKVQAIVGGTWDFLAETSFPLAERHKIPFITPSNPAEIFSESAEKNPWVFSNGLGLKATARAMEEFLAHLQPASAAIIVPNVPFGTSHADLFEKVAVKLNIKILARHDYSYEGYHDTLRTLAAQYARLKPALIFNAADYASLDIFVAETEKLKFNPYLLTTQHLDEAIYLSGKPERYKKAFGLYPQIKGREFNRLFREHYGRRAKVYTAQGYDALMFLVSALRHGIKIGDPESQFKYEGITGTYRLPAPGRALVETPAVIKSLKNGVFQTYTTKKR